MLLAAQFKGPSGSLVQVKDMIFRRTEGSYDLDFHTAPQRQYIIMLNGAVDVTTSDHKTRRFADGDVLLVEDTTGQQLDAPLTHIMRVFSSTSAETWCSLRQLLRFVPTCAAHSIQPLATTRLSGGAASLLCRQRPQVKGCGWWHQDKYFCDPGISGQGLTQAGVRSAEEALNACDSCKAFTE